MNQIIAMEKHILETWQNQLKRPLRSILRKPLALFLAVAFSLVSGLAPWATSPGLAAEMVPQTIITGHTVAAIAWSPDGCSLASGGLDKTIKIWDAASGRKLHTLTGHTDFVDKLAWSPDGRRLASGSWDKTIKIWDAASWRELRTITYTAHTDGDIEALAWSPDGRSLACCGDKTIKIWDAASWQVLHTITVSGHARALAWSPNGRSFSSIDSHPKIWDAASGRELCTLTGHYSVVTALSWNPDGRSLASCSWDLHHTIRIWDAVSGRQLRTITAGNNKRLNALAWSPDGRNLASGSRDNNTIELWDAASGRELRTITFTAHTDEYIQGLAWSPDGRSLASFGEGDAIKIWPLAQDPVMCQYVPMTRDERIKLDAQKMAADLLARNKATAAAKAAEAQRLADEAAVKRMAQQLVAQQTKQQGDDSIRTSGSDNGSAEVGEAASSKVSASDSAAKTPVKDKWALIVGISEFANPEYRLRYAAKDAQDFRNFLVNEANFRADHVKMLLNKDATKQHILEAFGDNFLPNLVRPGDLAVIYIATHGTPSSRDKGHKNYIAAYDTEKSKLYSTGVDMNEINDRIKSAVNTDRVLIVLDTCYSGNAAAGARGIENGGNFDLEEVARDMGTGRLVISSSGPQEQAWESKGYQNGIFTRYLINALRQNKGTIDVQKAFAMIKDKVQWEADRDYGAKQTPQLGGSWSGQELILSVPAVAPRPMSAR